MKTVKTMYLFFENLYTTMEDIPGTLLAEWGHKEEVQEMHCVIDVTNVNETVLDRSEAIMFHGLNNAIQEMNDWNE